ncbi:MAG: HD domain-containing protein [Treponema sp.]|jgi:poly(A) polymerase|nr:HD domain-containing protein [Treponema sp.]
MINTIAAHGFSADLLGFSAIDRYLGRDCLPFVTVVTDADISDLARIFEGLRFPGVAIADGAADEAGWAWYFLCRDPELPPVSALCRSPNDRQPCFKLLDFNQDGRTGRFRDPWGVYPWLRQIKTGNADTAKKTVYTHGYTHVDTHTTEPWWKNCNSGGGKSRAFMEAALILARYCDEEEYRPKLLKEIIRSLQCLNEDQIPGAEGQRLLLLGILASPNPGLGLEFLKNAGLLEELWPELAELDQVDQSKEFHPEGNAWKHTLETFRYRKAAAHNGALAGPMSYDARLSLGLLLHDLGKAHAESSGAHRFEGHAELGARQARRFLERLGFEGALVADICYLVRNHMLPAALPRLPLTRTQEVLESPLFPVLLELYRCDESSSFKGLDGYYESSAAYQAYLKHRRNPYRLADGKKMGKREMLGRTR